MSYSSRVYRQRNAHAHDENKQKAFSGGQHESKKSEKKNKSVQAKLSVNKPGDSYEQEADAVANTIVNQQSKTSGVHQKKISSIQRLSTSAEEEQLGTNDARMKRDKDIQEKPIQQKGEEPEKKEEDTAIQKMDEPKKEEEDKAVQKMDEPKKEEEDKAVQKMDEPKKEEEDKAVQKMDEPKKEEEDKAVQKMDEPKKEEEDKAVQKMDEPKKEEEDKAVQKMDEPKKEEEDKAVQKMDEPKKEEEDKAVQKMDEPKKEEEDKAVQKMDEPKKEEEDKAVQKMDEPKKEEEDKNVQTKAASQASTPSPGIATYLDQSAGKGKSLPAKTLNEMRAGFGIDFSKVRIHNDQDAVAANKELDAQAFTHGNDVYFNEGKFDPETSAGKFLLAHELTHVVQQGKGNDQKSVNRQAATPGATQQVPQISTPVPVGIQPGAGGEYETVINGAKVIIRKDITTRHLGKKAETKFKQSGGRISYRTRNGIVESFTGPDQIVVSIQTFYQRNAKPGDLSSYGRGTTAADKTAGDTSLGFHEGSHGTDFIHYITTNALPVFKGTSGMNTGEFVKNMQTYSSEMQLYFSNMAKQSVMNTDCVGTTIDQLTGSNVCVP